MPIRTTRRGWIIRGVIGTVVLVAVGAVGIPYVYVHFINKPEPRLTFEQRDAEEAKVADSAGVVDSAGTDVPQGNDVSGTWVVGDGSEIGYRVKESINGQATKAVGRSSTMEGSVTVADGKLAAAEFSVDVATLTSDSARRDGQFTGRIMNVEEFPVASFASLSTPDLTLPADGSTVPISVDGVLTMHGVEKTVTVAVEMRTKDDTVQIQGSIPVLFADYGILNPSLGPIKTGDTGLIEFLLTMRKS